MDETEKYERIERYLTGRMVASERQAFEEKLAKDPQLREEVSLHKELEEAVVEPEIAEFETALDKAMEDHRDNPARRRWPAILLAVILLLSLLWLGSRWLKNRKPAPAQIYAEYVDLPEALPDAIRLRSAAPGTDSSIPHTIEQLRQNWSALNQAYQMGNYAKALSLLENLRSTHPEFVEENPERYYYHRGLLELQLNRPVASADSFARVQSGNYAENAAWKRAMTLLLEGAPGGSQRSSAANQKQPHPRRAEARAVLKKLSVQ